MAQPRTFAALVDQDSVIVLEYREEKAGFRLVDTRSDTRRSTTPEAAAEIVVRMLRESGGRNSRVSVVLQHFGAFFHTMVLPPATDDVIRPIVLREVQRSFNISDPAIAYTIGPAVERRESPRDGGPVVPRQVLIAGAPRTVVTAFHQQLRKARIIVDGMTVIPEVLRRLYDSLDGSKEATAMLVCLASGPHLGFFVNGRLELAIDPPLAVDGEAPYDANMIVDQLERGSIFLRQQARGTVATRLLLTAPNNEYEQLSSTIEARTGLRVAPFGRAIGSPEAIVAMGAVLAARETDRLDLFPRLPALDKRMRAAFKGPSAAITALCFAAAIALIWAGAQFTSLLAERRRLLDLQGEVTRAAPTVAALRQSAQGREELAGIRKTLVGARADRRKLADLLSSLAASAPPGARVDSFNVQRTSDGLRTVVFGRASGPSGSAAVSAASGMYHYLQRHAPGLKKLDFQVSASRSRPQADTVANPAGRNELIFTVSFVAPQSEGGTP